MLPNNLKITNGYTDRVKKEAFREQHTTPALKNKERMREEIAEQTRQFLARGGEIKKIDPGVSGIRKGKVLLESSNKIVEQKDLTVRSRRGANNVPRKQAMINRKASSFYD